MRLFLSRSLHGNGDGGNTAGTRVNGDHIHGNTAGTGSGLTGLQMGSNAGGDTAVKCETSERSFSLAGHTCTL